MKENFEPKYICCEKCGKTLPHTNYRVAGKNYRGVTLYGRVKHCGCTKKQREAEKRLRDQRLRGYGAARKHNPGQVVLQVKHCGEGCYRGYINHGLFVDG